MAGFRMSQLFIITIKYQFDISSDTFNPSRSLHVPNRQAILSSLLGFTGVTLGVPLPNTQASNDIEAKFP